MKIYTSYFAKVRQLRDNGIMTVGIAIRPPTYYFGKHYKQLAPRVEMLKWSIPDYDREFNRMLSLLDPKQVLKDLEELSEGKDIALLCFEKNPQECHRSMVGKWLEDSLGISVKEFGEKAQETTFQMMLF